MPEISYIETTGIILHASTQQTREELVRLYSTDIQVDLLLYCLHNRFLMVWLILHRKKTLNTNMNRLTIYITDKENV